ncbi:MAG TPA: hypothetical protein H9747_11615 [Candidatus Blautia stercorigallinarum]|uniref:Rpn family recombination-promoting nuclease/putative transposase n=1 Tax=Candidatus Blautia stercorigallinarum TaxID=2838501 RepID=A0A9D1PEA0_9FIRM|nr:hypothetical protein [Candidatus Blautia stercorigallinarum]
MLFGDRERLLGLYNAISGKNYQDPEELEINTLENAIYMGMKNNLSFLIDDRLSLYEHQSTVNPNMPLRFLFYISDLYFCEQRAKRACLHDHLATAARVKDLGMTTEENFYGRKALSIPIPCFVIFYNGAEPQPDRKILRLSDLYTVRMKETQLELTAVLLNINRNHNRELMEACRDLKDYAEYVDRVRKYARELPLSEAVERAITECIREGILKEFLEKNRAEVKKMSIYEYDQEKHIRMERQDAWEDGVQEGIKEGELRGRNAQLVEQIKKKLDRGKSISRIAEELEETENRIQELIREYGLDK